MKLRIHLLLLYILLTSNLALAEDLLIDIQRETRTDTVEEKLKLVQEAYAAGQFDIALSLAESLKDTIQCDKQLNYEPGKPHFDIQTPQQVADLPAAWAEWAQGWQFVFPIQLSDSLGSSRSQEPVDLFLALEINQPSDLNRELRVAYLDPETNSLQEIPSQVYDIHRRSNKHYCHIVFFADVPARAKANYLLFYGNPQAELPQYKTDLKVEGDGYALNVSNHHYTAFLSKQTGQLERLRYTRQHGLELYSGGKGHGEPPTIDWSNDYVDQEHFQKLRIRNWAEPPNYEVDRGPLMIRVRRWGFPHSPVHPAFTPSRMHIDQTYTFYAGKDYFVKEGTMEATKDFDFATMRDDEWVLSGYSFTKKLWIDGAGHLHEGEVIGSEAQSLQGVGFYHDQSRDAFMALWLEHSAKGFRELAHTGAPTLHYPHHGQLWSRYPLGDGSQSFKQGTVLYQKNAYLVAPYPEENPAEEIEGLRNRLVQPLEVSAGNLSEPTNPTADGRLARDGETPESSPLKETLWKALHEIRDEQLYRIDSNVVDLGLIYDLKVSDGIVEILMTMPHRGRPIYQFFEFQGGGRITDGIRERLLQVDGIKQVLVDFTWHPAWTLDRLTPDGRRSLGLPLQ